MDTNGDFVFDTQGLKGLTLLLRTRPWQFKVFMSGKGHWCFY